MKMRTAISAALLALAMGLALAAVAKTKGTKSTGDTPATPSAAANQSEQDSNLRLEGEKRFRANCSRCHAAPPKFPPRMMGTIVRHMRVRATITDQDMRLILRYMTQ
ncbi:MAG TPA: cytochrome c [Candidatus Angelobacter sp.]